MRWASRHPFKDISPSEISGMTLVELVITIATAAIIGIPTGLLISEHLQQSILLRDSNLGAQLARYELERLDGLNNFFAADLATNAASPSTPVVTVIPLNPPPATYLMSPQSYPYTITRAVSCQIGDCTAGSPSTLQGVKRIVVTVTKSGSATPLIRLVTYRTKYVSFG